MEIENMCIFNGDENEIWFESKYPKKRKRNMMTERGHVVLLTTKWLNLTTKIPELSH